jgi:hypothetical protein
LLTTIVKFISVAPGATVCGVLALIRCRVPEADGDAFLVAVRATLAELAMRPGFVRGAVGRALDDGTQWVLSSEWETVGGYRRGLSAYEVKAALAPLMAYVDNAPSAFDVVAALDAGAAP